ncbi:Transposon Tf2-9 poly [Paramuricea clavata]|uniref:Transposon Tf2-9 poly n=1 Tax=Paramuricea clavata TaxID=317549 RepID=A0A6S7GNV6_PARCT|nr:Transposon Tf2-9 poly [Paramuricea clavata]
MAKVLDLPAIPPFSVSETSSSAQRWDKWTNSLDYYIRASGISDQKQKRAILLHLAGAEVQEIFETLPDTGEDYKTALEKLNAHFNSCKNIAFERHVFRQATQRAGESMDAFVTRLRTLAKTCQFDTSLDEMIRDQVIEKCASNDLLSIARSFELADRQALEIEQKFESSTHLNSIERNRDFQQPRRNSAKREDNNRQKCVCYCCGNEGHRAKDVQCPALDKTCRRCGKSGHFARVCRQKTNKPKQYRENARQLEQSDDDSSENECLFTLTAHNVHHRSDSLHMLEIEHIPVQMLIDSGASVNVLDLETYHRLKARKGVQLMPSTLPVYAYSSTTRLNILGTVSGRVKCNSAEIVAKFVVVHDQHAGCLLGRQTATQLGLLRVGPQVSSINCAVSPHSLRQRYPSVFDGVGKLTNYQQKISINTNIKPVAQPPRRIPFHVRKQVSAKLEELERLDIIEEVRGPTPWVSPLVVVPKSSGEIRVCVDMRQVNTAVIRERYPIPTVEESLQDLNGAAVFSKLDLKWGYHQIELDEQSRELTTFTTHDGLYRYKRLMFGISAAPEIYQHAIQQVLHGLPGVKNISDDIIVFGKDKSEHDRNLHGVLARLQERGLTLNSAKCMFSVSEITFLALIFLPVGFARTPSQSRLFVMPQHPRMLQRFAVFWA